MTNNPFAAFNFAVEIEGLLVGGFSAVTGLDARIETHEQPEGGVNGFVRTLPGRASFTNLVLRRGITISSLLWDWYTQVAGGLVRRRNGTVLMLDGRQAPLLGWNLRNALPVAWTGPELDAGGDQVGFESIELVHEGLTRCGILPALRVYRG